jgi:hypothetical protein
LDADVQVRGFTYSPDDGLELHLVVRQGWFREADMLSLVVAAPPMRPVEPDMALRLTWIPEGHGEEVSDAR